MVALAVVALIHTLSIAGFSLSLALLIDALISGAPTASVQTFALAFLAAVALRALTLVALDALAQRGGAQVKSELRRSALEALQRHGPGFMDSRSSTDITNLLARGIDALDVYFGRYLPQLVLTAIQLPGLLIILWVTDVPTGIAITLALPVIPIFMVLIGWATQSVQKRQWEGMQVLARGFIDLVEGLPTLKIFGRHWRQVDKIRDMTRQFRKRTMAVLRVSFLSSFVLELAASFSVAIVAVSVGIRLIDGSLPLWLGLFVLVLVPEVYLPLRQVGAQFHNAADGLTAAEDLFEVLESPVEAPTVSPAPLDASGDLELIDVAALRAGGPVAQPLRARLVPGSITLLEGPSGSGKSSLVDALMGFVPHSGRVRFGGEDVEPGQLRPLIAWSPQNPSLLAGSVADNVSVGDQTPDQALVGASLQRAGLADLNPEQRLGVHGSGLSGGQAQRLALARALYRHSVHGCPIAIFDEVTSALDERTEDLVWEAIDDLASRGVICLVISHRLRASDRAHQTVTLHPVRSTVGGG